MNKTLEMVELCDTPPIHELPIPETRQFDISADDTSTEFNPSPEVAALIEDNRAVFSGKKYQFFVTNFESGKAQGRIMLEEELWP